MSLEGSSLRARRVGRFAGAIALALVFTGSSRANASAAWGEVSLEGDDAQVALDRHGVATIRHDLKLTVPAHRFRGFVIDGVDEGARAPEDLPTDGPSWPATITSDDGERYEAAVEPAKEARRLRVRIVGEGLGKGTYVVALRWVVPLRSQGALRREGESLLLDWSPLRWPAGYDGGRVTFLFPHAPSEPRLSPSTADGAAIVESTRAESGDALTLVRPHVPLADDAHWTVLADPRAFDDEAIDPASAKASLAAPIATPLRAQATKLAAALALGAAAAWLAWSRRRSGSKTRPFAPIVPLGPKLDAPFARALMTGAASTSAALAAFAGRADLEAGALLVACACVTLRPLRTTERPRARGRWLAVPTANGERISTTRAPSDWLCLAASALCLGPAIALAAIGRVHVAVACAIASSLPIAAFATGRTTQSSLLAAQTIGAALVPFADAIDAKLRRLRRRSKRDGEAGVAPKLRWISRRARPSRPDDVRLECAATPLARAAGLVSIELAMAVARGPLSDRLVPELMVRTQAGSRAEALLRGAHFEARHLVDEAWSLGRTADESVLSLRPARSSPRSLATWLLRVVATLDDRVRLAEKAPKSSPRRAVAAA